MAFINLLHNGYQGKLGETVGQKWKNQRTVRTYNPHNNSKSEAQLQQRTKYKENLETATTFYPSAFNLIVPKKKPMNRFNFYTSIIPVLAENLQKGSMQFPLGDYKTKNILSTWAGTKNNEIWAYILLPDGEPPKNISSIPQSIILATDGKGRIVSFPNGILAGEILPKRPKQGATPYPFPRGYFVKTNLNEAERHTILLSLGRKERGVTKWSEVTMLQPVFPMEDDQLEDL